MNGIRKFPVINGWKQCVACEENKPFTPEFYTRDASAPGGLTAKCKECRYKQKRKWEIENSGKSRESQRAYYAKTREQYLARKQDWKSKNREKTREYAKTYAEKHPEKIKSRYKKWSSLPENKLAQNLRARIRRCLKAGKPIYKDMEKILGYSITDLKNHIASTFKAGMSWENYSYEIWHVDHIRPVSSYKLTLQNGEVDFEEVRKCWALKNLRAMWGKDNLIKSDKWPHSTKV